MLSSRKSANTVTETVSTRGPCYRQRARLRLLLLHVSVHVCKWDDVRSYRARVILGWEMRRVGHQSVQGAGERSEAFVVRQVRCSPIHSGFVPSNVSQVGLFKLFTSVVLARDFHESRRRARYQCLRCVTPASARLRIVTQGPAQVAFPALMIKSAQPRSLDGGWGLGRSLLP